MQWLADICVRRPVFATVIILALAVVGFFGYTKLGVDRFPKVDFPIVSITLRQDGASPEEMETEVVDKVEEAVNTVSGIDQLQSTSYEGVAVVSVTFQLEKDINVAAEEVRDKVNGVLNDLPTDLKPPVIDKVDTDAAAIIEYALSSPGNIRDTTEYADKTLRRRLESISGVGQVNILGGRKRQINLWLDPDKMRSRNLTPTDVQRALQSQNIQVPGGLVDQNTRELTLRTYGRVPSSEDFNGIVIKKVGDTPIHISDIARVEDSVEEANSVANLNGQPTVLLSIRKQSGTNTVATIDAIKERVKEIEKSLPSGYKLKVTRDQSEFIKASTNAVKEHLVVGSVLAAIVVLVFLWNIRTTIISAIAIPTSIVSTFGLMWAMGFTLNGLTLLALTLSVGIVIDDAIVVLENIYRFIEEKGMNPFEAAIEGTREIGLAVLATTLSLIAIFLPVAFMTGIVGRFLNSFGLTMAFAIFVSLIVSFSLTPMLASRWLKKPNTAAHGPDTPDNMPIGVESEESRRAAQAAGAEKSSKESGFFRPIDAVYTVLLKWAMRHRWVIVLVSIATLVSTVPLIGAVGKNFLPEDDESQFQINVRAPEGTSLTATEALGNRITEEVRKVKGVAYTVVTVGNNQQQTRNLLEIYVKMTPVEKRSNFSQQDAMQQVRAEILPRFGNLRTAVTTVAAISGAGANYPVSYTVSGPDLKVLQDVSVKAVAEMKQIPGLVDPDSNLVVGQPELGVRIERKRAEDLGVSVSDIANALRLVVGGAKVSDFSEGGEQYEVHVRSELANRQDEGRIGEVVVPSTVAAGGTVPLRDVVTFTHGVGPSQIVRLNRQRQVTLNANVKSGGSASDIQAKVTDIVKKMNLPPAYTTGVTGTSREQAKAAVAFLQAFLLGIIFMYLILAAQFESWVHPITILIALPLTFPFALLAILLFHVSLNIFSVLGILVLFGVVKKNGILQVDHTNQLRARGMTRYDAIIAANRDRLRPILMTTVAFVAGLIPLVISSGTGSGTNRNIGFTVIGGQTFSLLLTLLATPVFYSLFDDIITTPLWGKLRDGYGRLTSRFRRA